MNPKQEIQRNIFGKRLEQLLLSANIKNSTVANVLSYDVSYISKWTSGKAIPSRKNIEAIVTEIGRLIVEQASTRGRAALQKYYGAEEDPKLQNAIISTLRDAYFETIGEIDEESYYSNASLQVLPRGKFSLMEDFAQMIEPDQEMDIVMLADLFALDHISKLHLAGIEAQHFRLRTPKENLRIDYILDLESLRGDSVYDVVLWIHLMTNFSLCGFRLYFSEQAKGKLLIAAKDTYAGITLLNEKQFLCTTVTRDKKTVNEVYDSVSNMIDPDKQVFYSVTMERMLVKHEYFRNLLSQNNRWLIGHITEQFLPSELFEELLNRCYEQEQEERKEAARAYTLASSTFSKNYSRIMMYNSALVDFALSGELDFFNHKMILEVEQRKQVLLHMKRLFDEMESDHVKLIKEGFSDDFKYITNPCLFLSDTASYLRLENKIYESNLLLIKAEAAKNIFDTFYETIWASGTDLVMEDQREILRSLENLIEMTDLM